MESIESTLGWMYTRITIAVAVARAGREDAEFIGTIPNNPNTIASLVRKLGQPEELCFCYEAGPCGYGIYRQLTDMGLSA